MENLLNPLGTAIPYAIVDSIFLMHSVAQASKVNC